LTFVSREICKNLLGYTPISQNKYDDPWLSEYLVKYVDAKKKLESFISMCMEKKMDSHRIDNMASTLEGFENLFSNLRGLEVEALYF
jgi:dephospho-CoA kinase